jgi:hypothetical protein
MNSLTLLELSHFESSTMNRVSDKNVRDLRAFYEKCDDEDFLSVLQYFMNGISIKKN